MTNEEKLALLQTMSKKDSSGGSSLVLTSSRQESRAQAGLACAARCHPALELS